ncbi:MAG: hypothetical protein HC788_14735 [Sphingopyxis sp.]|nr:hypothetical protein [Sphingopyxis sp.]
MLDRTEALKTMTQIVGPGTVRLAGFYVGYSGSYPKKAAALMDRAQVQMRDYVSREWTRSAEAGLIATRQLRSAFRLLAQLRMIQIGNGAAATPDDVAEAFDALQQVMVNDTAVAAQRAAVARLLDDPALATIYEQRNAAALSVAEFEQILQTLDRKTFRDKLAEAQADLARLEGELLSRAPEMARMLDLKGLSLAETQARLKGDEAVIILHAATKHVDAMLVRNSSTPQVWRVPLLLDSTQAGDGDASDTLAERILDIRVAMDATAGSELPLGVSGISCVGVRFSFTPPLLG